MTFTMFRVFRVKDTTKAVIKEKEEGEERVESREKVVSLKYLG